VAFAGFAAVGWIAGGTRFEASFGKHEAGVAATETDTGAVVGSGFRNHATGMT